MDCHTPKQNHNTSKSHLAEICGASPSTVRRWIKMHEPALKLLGYNRTQKVLTPRQWNYITEKLVINE